MVSSQLSGKRMAWVASLLYRGQDRRTRAEAKEKQAAAARVKLSKADEVRLQEILDTR